MAAVVDQVLVDLVGDRDEVALDAQRGRVLPLAGGMSPDSPYARQVHIHQKSQPDLPQKVLQPLRELADRYGRALLLGELGGFSYVEIGVICETTPAAVRSMLNAAPPPMADWTLTVYVVPVDVTVKVLPSADTVRRLTTVGFPLSVYAVSIVFASTRFITTMSPSRMS